VRNNTLPDSAAVASQTCQLAQNSVKILTYSSSRSSKVDDFAFLVRIERAYASSY